MTPAWMCKWYICKYENVSLYDCTVTVLCVCLPTRLDEDKSSLVKVLLSACHHNCIEFLCIVDKG